jgi:hypothetical protein
MARLPTAVVLRLLGRSVSGLVYQLVGGFAGWAEDLLTVLFGSLLSVGGVLFVANLAVDAKLPWIAWVLALFWIVFDGPYLRRLWRGMRGKEKPLAVAVAMGQPSWPSWLRPLVACWWMGHFAIAGLLAYLFDSASMNRTAVPFGIYLGYLLKQVVVTTAICSTANCYLVLAAAAFTREMQSLQTIWRRRILLDLALALVVCVIPAKLS